MTEPKNSVRSVACIINPHAARKKWLRRKRLHKYLKENLPGLKYFVLTEKERTIELARELSCRSETIVAIGGDGTIADVLQGIREAGREKDVLFGIVPLGSGNAFRKSLSIPKNFKRAVNVLHEGEAKEISLMDVGGKAAGFASIGATALATLEKIKHNIHGFWGHVLNGIKLLGLPRWEVEVELEDGIDDQGQPFGHQLLKLKMVDCIVAKSNYFGYSCLIAPLASLEDDYLDITLFEVSSLTMLLAAPLIYLGLFQRTQRHFKARKMVIRGKDLPIQYHGERLGVQDTVEVKVLPRTIKVICPPRA
jgi:diacylglycerol kinase family enzyme